LASGVYLFVSDLYDFFQTWVDPVSPHVKARPLCKKRHHIKEDCLLRIEEEHMLEKLKEKRWEKTFGGVRNFIF
jgi:hypothetical protein